MSAAPGIASACYNGSLTDEPSVSGALGRAGFGRAARREKVRLLNLAARALERSGGSPNDACVFFVPGRIEVLGKHTDYAGGQSILAASEQGFCLAASLRDDAAVSVTTVQNGRADTVRFDLSRDLTSRMGHWSNYPMTVARRICRNFPGRLHGADIALSADLPNAAGMSSSSALLVGVFLVLAYANRLDRRSEYRQNVRSPVDLASYLGTVENGRSFGSLAGDTGVGTFGGSEDQTAIFCARPRHFVQYAYCPARFQRAVALPTGYQFVIGVTGVVAEKTGAARERYNAASGMAAAIAAAWRDATGRDEPHLAAILENHPDGLERLRSILSGRPGGPFGAERLIRRLEHFAIENQTIVPKAGDALERGDVGEFVRLVELSQRSGERLLGNQIPETAFLADSAKDAGATAASAFGAGFGGSVWALVPKDDVDPFTTQWSAAYHARFPEQTARSRFFATQAGPAAFRLR